MFQPNEEKSQKLRDLLDFASKFKRGDTLTYVDIAHVTGVYRDCAGWSSLIYKFKKELERERGIVLLNEHDVGYRLCTTEEQLQVYPRKKQKSSIRRQKEGMSAVEALDEPDMSLAQKQYRALSLRNMAEDIRSIKNHIKQLDRFLRKSDTLPMHVCI